MTAPVVSVAYPDAELVTMAIHKLLVAANPGLKIVTFLPANWVPPLVQINRIGGAPDVRDVTDYPLVRCAYYGVDRMGAWNLAAQGEGVMIGMRHRAVEVPAYGVGAEILIDSVDIAVGGQQLPDVNPDDRRVVKDFLLGLRRPHHLVT